MRSLTCLLMLAASTALAQEEPAPSGEEPSEQEMARPGSESPEGVRAGGYDGPRHRTQAFLVPMDEGARIPTTRVAQALQGLLLNTPRYQVVDLGKALSVESTAEQSVRAEEGRRLLAEGDQAAAGKGWPEAAAMYQRAVQEMARGLPAVPAREYAGAVLRMGAAQWMSGEEKPAREAFALVARIDPLQQLDASGSEPAAEVQLQAARMESDAGPRGTLETEARPAGARVQVDGEVKGSSPVHLELPAGKHFVRVERAGFYPYAELVEIAPRKPRKLSITLAATPAAASLNQLIAGASDEVGRGAAGKNLSALAEKFSLERVLIGSVRSQQGKVSLLLTLVDAPGQRVVGRQSLRLIADGTDADQIESDTQSAARKLIVEDGAAEAARRALMPGSLPVAPGANDPELVQRERKVVMPAGAAAPASKRAKGLRDKTGTEEWEEE